MSYLARETLVSALINGAISVAFFLGVFALSATVPVWGLGNYAFDFVPQSFAIGVMATLIPGLLCRRALASRRLVIPAPPPTAGSIAAKALGHGFFAVLLGAGLTSAALWLTGADTLGYAQAFVLKAAYGTALGATVTAVTLRRMLAAA